VIGLHDVTLRDGNHALRHQLSTEQVRRYCDLADQSKVDVVEVGHGNGIGASSYLVGKSFETDFDLLSQARESLKRAKLGIHVIPGFATFKRDVAMAIDCGVDVFRVAAHVTEADVCSAHLERLTGLGVFTTGVLMMSHMASTEVLTSEALKLRDHGAGGFVFMDSAGVFRPEDVAVRSRSLRDSLGPTYPIGFHAHNNLGYGLANSISAISNGADSIDASAAGLGAGAGNLNLELWGVWLQDQGHLDESESDIFISMAELIEDLFTPNLPRISSQSVRSGLAGAFSGYSPQVAMASQSHGVSTQAIWREIGARGLVAGQESAIWEIAQDLSNL